MFQKDLRSRNAGGHNFSILRMQLSAGRKNKDFSVKIYRTRIYPLCLYSSHSGVQSSVVTLLVSKCTGEMYATSWTFLSRFFKTFLLPLSHLRCLRFGRSTVSVPLFSFIRWGRPRGMLHVLSTVYFLLRALAFRDYFSESFCISNSNSCKDSTCPTALRSFFDAARTVPMTFLVKSSPSLLLFAKEPSQKTCLN